MATIELENAAVSRPIKRKSSLNELEVKFPGERNCMNVGKENREISPKIGRVLNQIETDYYNKMNLSTLGKFVDLNPDYLCRKFKKEVGVTLHEYIQMTRVKKAAYQLAQSRNTVKEISHAVGFSRPEIFTRTFKKITGYSPRAYRKKYKGKNF